MEWLLILLIVLTIAINIRSIITLTKFKNQRKLMLENGRAINSSMEEFVANLEEENEELYHRLVEHIAQKESRMEERIRELEQKFDNNLGNISSNSGAVSEKTEVDKQISIVNMAEPEIHQDLSENEKIEQLHKHGFSPAQIAKVVPVERGEIELIINMLKRKQRYQK